MNLKISLLIILIITSSYQVAVITNEYLKINIGLTPPYSHNAGMKQSLPIEAIASVDLMYEYEIPDFNLSKKLFEKIYEQQRIIEFAYPIRFREDSKFLLSFADENLGFDYKLISKKDNIALYEKK